MSEQTNPQPPPKPKKPPKGYPKARLVIEEVYQSAEKYPDVRQALKTGTKDDLLKALAAHKSKISRQDFDAMVMIGVDYFLDEYEGVFWQWEADDE